MKSILFRRCRRFFPVLFFIAVVMSAVVPVHGQAAETLFFGSDVHGADAIPADPEDYDPNIYKLYNLLKTSCGGTYDMVGLVGDYNSSGWDAGTGDKNDILACISELDTPVPEENIVLSQGNHECSDEEPGDTYTHGPGAVSLSGAENYEVYVINWNDFYNYTGSGNCDVSASGIVGELETYLSDRTGEKVVFIMCHAPLHSTREDGDGTVCSGTINQDAAQRIFCVLQDYGKKLDIVFLWGHNHHGGYDSNIRKIAVPGQTISTSATPGSDFIASVATEPLTFTCLNAGYVNADNTATIITVDESDIVIQRCGDDGGLSATVPRKKPSVVLLFDTSGSMALNVDNDTADEEYEKKIELAKDAAEPFVNLLSLYSGDAGIGIATFPKQDYDGCNAEEIRSVEPITSDPTDIISDIETLDTGGRTPMIAGLELASDMLPSMDRKAIMLLSDGYHNCPSVVTVDTDPESDYGTMLSMLDDVFVYTIGFSRPGETDGHFLDDLAAETEGLFYDVPKQADFDPATWESDAPVALSLIYSKIFSDALQLEEGADPISTIGRGETNTHDIAINAVDDKITFLLSWHTPSGKQLELQVKSSDGEIVSAGSRGVTYRHGRTYKLFFVEASFLKVPGKVGGDPWQIVVTGAGVGAGETETYQYCVILDSALKMKASLDRKSYGTGDTVTLSAKLTLAGEPMPGLENVAVEIDAPSDGAGNWFAENRVSANQLASVDTEKEGDTFSDIQRKAIYLLDRAKVAFPGQMEAVTLPLYDDGTHGDLAAGDGIYTNQYSDTVKEGTYSFTFRARGSVYEGDIFSREKLIQKYVTVNTSPDAITLDMTFSGIADNGNQYLLTVTPKDVYGNFLGPRFAESIDIVLSAGILVGEITDNLDGTYTQRIALPEGVSWQDVAAAVEVNGVTATLPLPEPTTGHGMGWVLWLLIILLIICAIAIFIILR